MSDQGSIVWTPQKALSNVGAMPVRVRTLSGVLVGSGVSGQPIAVRDGLYMISVLLPNGEEISAKRATRVSPGQVATPQILLPDVDTRATLVSRANPSTFEATQQLEATAGPVPVSRGATCIAQQWRGAWLANWPDPKAALESGLMEETRLLSEQDQTILFADETHDRFLITRHEHEGRKILRFSLVPHDQCIACVGEEAERAMILATLREGAPVPTIKYASAASTETNALLNFVDQGVLGEMQAVSSAFINAGEQAILQTRVSLLRGVTGAYVMLRVNVLDGIEAFLGQLRELAPALPDTHILRCELLARQGRHEEAVAALCDATDALCPWFRAGISYLLERLRFYLDLDEETQATLNLHPDDWKRFGHAKARLERMAPMLVTTQIFTTFDIPA